MLPILHPGDVVLVDRQDRDVMTPGRIMLVMDPDGAGMIKRVAVEEVKSERDWRIVFYSDNVANHPPIVYSLREDFLGDWDRAVVGRHSGVERHKRDVELLWMTFAVRRGLTQRGRRE